jgi:flagellar biogenesis protein FliO
MRTAPGFLLSTVIVSLPAAAHAATGELGFGRMLAQTALSLVLVCLLAVVVLRLLARAGIGQRAADGGRLDVIARLGVGPRQSVLAIRVLDRVLVVGQTPAGLSRLTEVSFAQWQTGGRGFASLLEEPTEGAAPQRVEPDSTNEIVA